MVEFEHLQTIAESATGYAGSSYYEDEMPWFSLEETASFLPIVCLECQNDLIELNQQANEAMVEAAVSHLRYGSYLDPVALTEANLDGIKNTISAGFERIKQYIKAIIAKLRQLIETTFKSGTKLWAQYGSKLGDNFPDVSIETYEFKGDDVLKQPREINLDNLIKDVFGDFPPPESIAGSKSEGFEEKIKSLKDISTGERDRMLVSHVIGEKLSDSGWKDELENLFWGEKKEYKYNEGKFTKTFIEKCLKNSGAELKTVQAQYDNLLKQVETMEKRVKAAASKARGGAFGNKDESFWNVDSYCREYTKIVHEAVKAVAYVKSTAVRYFRERDKAARTMLVKLINYKPKKTDTESESYYGYDDSFSFDY